MNTIEKLKHARRVSVPLVAINTPDPAATILTVAKNFGGNGTPVPIVQWDVCRGVLAVNEAGREVARMTGEGEDDVTLGQPTLFLAKAADYPADTIVFMHSANAYWDVSPAIPQAVWNLRDQYKSDRRMLILLGADVQPPPSLKDDIVVLDESLPGDEELSQIVQECDQARGQELLPDVERGKAVEAVRGLNAFAAEQAVSMSLRKDGIDLDHLWESKRTQIRQTEGLSVFKNETTFADVGGLDSFKSYMRLIMGGKNAPTLVVWLDEIGTTGVASRGDLSGVNQGMEGHLLQWLQDHRVFGVMLAGVQGAGKSEICKAVGGEFGKLVIRLDLEATKGSLVGESERQLRAATKVIEACAGGGSVLWIATANSIDGLSGAMRNRFVDTFFFDLPDKTERMPIWKVWMNKLGLKGKPFTGDDGWNGRNIWQCCDKAWRMDKSPAEVAKWINPVAITDREGIEKLRRQADGRYLSASHDGVYRMQSKKRARLVETE